jgi:hypothetical protein
MQPKINLEKKDRGPKIGEYLYHPGKAYPLFSSVPDFQAFLRLAYNRFDCDELAINLTADASSTNDRDPPVITWLSQADLA